MKLKFWYIDVFSAQRFKGNPAAVFFESDDLEPQIMARIANELNLSETVFLQKSSLADYKVRIFTPKVELPFAGHPTIAANFAYRNFYNINKEILTQECGVGLIEVKKKDEIYFVTQKDPQFMPLTHSRSQMAQMLGISLEEIMHYEMEKISTGIWWAVVMLRNQDSVSSVKADHEKIIEFSKKENVVGLQVFAKNSVGDAGIHIRTFAPLVGVFEDPSCGSGNGCVAAYIAKNGILEKSNYVASQGKELGRESRLFVGFDKAEDVIKNIRVGGEAVRVLEGEIEI